MTTIQNETDLTFAFLWVLAEAENGVWGTTRTYTMVYEGRNVSLKITATPRGASAVGRVSWVSSGDIQNTRERRFSWAHDCDFDRRPSEGDWRTILRVAEGECEQLI